MTNILDTFNKATSVGRFAVYLVIVLFGAGITWGFAQSGITENKEKNIQQDQIIAEIRRDMSEIKTKSAVQANDIDYIKRSLSDIQDDTEEQTEILREIRVNQNRSD